METMFSLEFKFQGKSHGAIISVKQIKGITSYNITVMNGDLERLLFGNNVLVRENGVLVNTNKDKMEPEVASLHSVITASLENRLNSKFMMEPDYQ